MKSFKLKFGGAEKGPSADEKSPASSQAKAPLPQDQTANPVRDHSAEGRSMPLGSEDDDSSTQADLQLVAKAQAGDLFAFRDLVSKYQARAQAVALGIVGNHHDAEDLIQEAFLKAFRNLHSFRGQSGFYTWLYRIVFNLAIDLGRRKYRKSEIQARDAQVFDGGRGHGSVDPSSYLSRTPGPDELLDRAELRSRIAQAIGQLSPDHRAVIIMREVEGLSYEEISETLGCSKGTVMSRLHHARKKLQRALSDMIDIMPPRGGAPGADPLNATGSSNDADPEDNNGVFSLKDTARTSQISGSNSETDSTFHDEGQFLRPRDVEKVSEPRSGQSDWTERAADRAIGADTPLQGNPVQESSPQTRSKQGGEREQGGNSLSGLKHRLVEADR